MKDVSKAMKRQRVNQHETALSSDDDTPESSRSIREKDLRSFSMSLPMSLLRAREAVMRHFRTSLREHQVTEQQWRVIRAISSIGEADVNDLVRLTFLLGPSLSRILRGLEVSGYIKRRTDEEDHRRSVLSLTEKGEELIRRHTPQSAQIYQRIAEAYGQERLQLLQSMLAELETSMNSFNILSIDNDDPADDPR